MSKLDTEIENVAEEINDIGCRIYDLEMKKYGLEEYLEELERRRARGDID